MKSKLIITLYAACFISSASTVVQAQTLPEQAISRLNELSHKFVHCSAFFYVVADGIKSRGNPQQADTIQQYIRQGDLMRDKAAILATEIGQKPEVIKIRWEMSVKDLWAEMDNHYKNFSIILNKYLDQCIELQNNSKRHMQEAVLGQ